MPFLPDKYEHIFFDLDHTLWDFEKNSLDTLSELYQKHELIKLGSFCVDRFIEQFQEVNSRLWMQNDEGKLDRESLRRLRFRMVCQQLGLDNEEIASRIGEDYLALCPTKTALLPYALDILRYLDQHYSLYILTNGFSDVQAIKLDSAGILPFFQGIFTAEDLKVGKPHKAYFTQVMQQIDAQPGQCLMIGDNLKTDILGAQNAGIDHVYYNPNKRRYHMQVQHEIHCLSQLREML